MNPLMHYREAGPEGLDAVRLLREKLNAHHAGLSSLFGSAMRLRTFEDRRRELQAKAKGGRCLVDLVSAGADEPGIAYCISTVSGDGLGEIDSIFVEESWRGRGIGTELIRRALAWLEGMGASSKVVAVAQGNEEALALYKRLGFHPRTIVLQHTDDDPA
jgi:ribosomal protein S18 acetylase RimI-like enzyme